MSYNEGGNYPYHHHHHHAGYYGGGYGGYGYYPTQHYHHYPHYPPQHPPQVPTVTPPQPGVKPAAQVRKPLEEPKPAAKIDHRKNALPIIDPSTQEEVKVATKPAKKLSADAPSFVPPSFVVAAQAVEPPAPVAPVTPVSPPAEPIVETEKPEVAEVQATTPTSSEPVPSTPSSDDQFETPSPPAESIHTPPQSPKSGDTPTSPAVRTGPRIKYDLQYMLQLGESKEFDPPKDFNFTLPTTPTSPKDRDRPQLKRPTGFNKPVPKAPSSPVSGGDLRSKLMGSRVVALEHRADVAFTAQKDDGEEAKTLKKVKGILNRITPTTYESLFEQLWSTLMGGGVDIMGSLEKIISIIFETALDQVSFSSMYADICRDLCKHTQDQKGSVSEGEVTLAAFRRILLTKCQQRFEEGCKHEPAEIPEDATDDQKDVMKRKELKFRQASIGNIKFISELFRRSLLSEKIMHAVIKQLLLTTDHSDPSNVDMLEVLCTLLTSVGQRLDRPQAKDFIDHYFEVMGRISTTHPVPRIRFLVLDVIELRHSNWINRVVGSKEVEDLPRRPSEARTPTAGVTPKAKSERADGWETVSKPTRPKKDTKPTAPTRSLADRAEIMMAAATATSTRPSLGRPQTAAAKAAAAAAEKAAAEAAAAERGSPTAAAADEAVDDEEDEDMTLPSKAKTTLQEWEGDEDDVAGYLANEIGGRKAPRFAAAMIIFAVAKNNRQPERAKLVRIVECWMKRELIYARHLQKALGQSLTEAKELEMWTDVPKLWHNFVELLVPFLTKKLLPCAAVEGFVAELLGDESTAPEAIELLLTLATALDADGFEGFDPDLAGELLARITKETTAKAKAKAKPLTLAALIKELQKLRS